jgi:hypothetical protein
MISARYYLKISLLPGKPPIAMITDSTVPVGVSPAIPGRPLKICSEVFLRLPDAEMDGAEIVDETLIC